MALGKRQLFSIFVSNYLCILFLVLLGSNLVICDDFEDDSLKHALEAVERRQRDFKLQDNEYYGQPENIGYGFQKTLGLFDNNGPASELGSYDSAPKKVPYLPNVFSKWNFGNGPWDGDSDNWKSNFRERLSKNDYFINEKDVGDEEYGPAGLEYLQLLKNLWAKYQQGRGEDVNLEDMTDEQVEEILSALRGDDGLVGGDYSAPDGGDFDVVPIRKGKNYGVFDGFGDRMKRYPSFGQDYYGKRNLYPQNLNYDIPPEKEFLYSLKYVNPEFNREAVENLRDEGYDVLGEEKDGDVMRILDNAMNRPRYDDRDIEAPYWSREEGDEEVWMPGPISLSKDRYGGFDRGEKRSDLTPRHFKPHNGIHLNTKRFPVKRSANAEMKKESTTTETVPKEVTNIFSTMETTTVPPKKGSQKKPTEALKKQNATKPEVTKHRDDKKVVRRSGKYADEKFVSSQGNEEIAYIFGGNGKTVSKKAIDWSQYFGIDKRSPQGRLKDDSKQRAEKHFMAPKSKRFPSERANLGNVNYLDRSQYEVPLDVKMPIRNNYAYDMGANIDKVETKIGDIEEKLIDDAVKYTGAHSGGNNEDLNEVKNNVIQHLEAAYSLEKMKNALEEFKSLVKPIKNAAAVAAAAEESAKKTSTEAPKTTTTGMKVNSNPKKPGARRKPAMDTTKRVAVKKEGVKGFFNQEPRDDLEFLRDEPYPYTQYDNEEACPLLDKILQNCLRVEEMTGRYAEVLVPLCTLQQICYYCGVERGFASVSTCDESYLREAENVCQGRSECLINARDSMLAIQDLYELEVIRDNGRPNTYGSCMPNSCIQKYFFNSPGAIYPLEIKK